jgi:hypothetical protein
MAIEHLLVSAHSEWEIYETKVYLYGLIMMMMMMMMMIMLLNQLYI